jgi:hypothetical protein
MKILGLYKTHKCLNDFSYCNCCCLLYRFYVLFPNEKLDSTVELISNSNQTNSIEKLSVISNYEMNLRSYITKENRYIEDRFFE